LPVDGRSAEEVAERADFFKRLLQYQIGSPAFTSINLTCHPSIGNLLAEVYFAITNAYKSGLLPPGSRTDPIKQAALTCAAVVTVNPIRPISTEIDQEEIIYANPMFAMRCACSIIDHPYHTRSFDERRRVYRGLPGLCVRPADAMIQEALQNDCRTTSTWTIELSSRERSQLDILVNMFAVYKEMPIFAKSVSA
jgi:hypothetical protein